METGSSIAVAHLKETKTEADKLDNFELELIERDRKAAEDPALATILDSLKAEKVGFPQPVVALLMVQKIVKMFTLQEPQKGSFAASWEAAVSKTGLELADGSATVMNVFCVKDEDQLVCVRGCGMHRLLNACSLPCGKQRVQVRVSSRSGLCRNC